MMLKPMLMGAFQNLSLSQTLNLNLNLSQTLNLNRGLNQDQVRWSTAPPPLSLSAMAAPRQGATVRTPRPDLICEDRISIGSSSMRRRNQRDVVIESSSMEASRTQA